MWCRWDTTSEHLFLRRVLCLLPGLLLCASSGCSPYVSLNLSFELTGGRCHSEAYGALTPCLVKLVMLKTYFCAYTSKARLGVFWNQGAITHSRGT